MSGFKYVRRLNIRKSVELEYFDINISSKAQEKEALQGNISEIFLLDTLKTTF